MMPALLLAWTLGGSLPKTFVPPPILMYHRVDVDRPPDPVGRSLTLSPEQFDEQLAFFKAHGIAVISMESFYERLREGNTLSNVVVATFDDGYSDQYSYAVPILRRYGDTATFYVITGNVGNGRHLTWGEIRAMVRDGMDVDAHGVAHLDLSHMTRAQQHYQIATSVELLRHELGVPAASYAFPSGRFDAATLPILRDAGVLFAVTTDPRYVIRPPNRLELTRLRVRSTWGLDDFVRAVDRARAGLRPVAGTI